MASFRFNSSQVFLTYAQCDLDKQTLADYLQTFGPVLKYIVCAEEHKDGKPHLHAYCKWQKKLNLSRANCFDLQGHHPNITKPKSYFAVCRYVRKGDDYIEFGMDAKQEEQARSSKTRIMGQAMIQCKTEAQLKQLATTEYQEMVPKFDHYKKAFNCYRFTGCEPYGQDTPRGIWISGKPKSGKSHWVREEYGTDLYWKDSTSKWWDGYDNQKYVLIDDLDTDCLSHYLKIWADQYPCSGETKGGTVALMHRVLIVTSNFTISDLFSDKSMITIEAIQRRFCCHVMTDREMF